MSKSEFAAVLEISRAFLSQLLHGTRKPNLELAVRLADLTGIPIVSWVTTHASESDQQKKTRRKNTRINKQLTGNRVS